MQETIIKNANGLLVARIREDNNGFQQICDATSKLLGRYNPQSNTTTDANNAIVARGNALTSLIRF